MTRGKETHKHDDSCNDNNNNIDDHDYSEFEKCIVMEVLVATMRKGSSEWYCRKVSTLIFAANDAYL